MVEARHYEGEARALEVVREMFAQYYRSRPEISVTEPEKREFGYFDFARHLMVRHLAFRSLEELLSNLMRVVPLHAYRSSAYFTYPSAPMEEKGWEGADLVFDIDADHVDPPCGGQHVLRFCKEHGLVKGEVCDSCNVGPVEVDWVCEQCIEGARVEVVKLLEVLTTDLGIREEEVEVNFSGNRGFHVVVYSKELRALDQTARREIVQYLTCEGISLVPPGLRRSRGRPRRGVQLQPELDAWGWRGRIWRNLYVKLAGRSDGDDPDSVFQTLSSSDLRKALTEAVREESVKIDPVVTSDVHRLVRLSNSLNGKTGLIAKRVPLDRVEDFDPFKEAVGIQGRPIKVRIYYAPEFRLLNEVYREVQFPEVVTVPAHVAAFLILKGLATIV
ncbi:MAG: DNA primase small subunit domain-containing protein [Nitrososphaerota archaeon]|nr:DNA primase small subunit domain-containing protein [Nitrososphaerota archaeon]